MNKGLRIDSVFKNQLQGMEQAGADENWQRLEKPLLEQNKKKKRRGAAGLLGLLLLLGGGAALVWSMVGTTNKTTTPLVQTPQQKTDAVTNDVQLATNTPININNNNINNTITDRNNPNTLNQQRRQRVNISGVEMNTVNNSDRLTPPVFNKNGAQKMNITAAAAEENNEEELIAVAVPVTNEQESKLNETLTQFITHIQQTEQQKERNKETLADKITEPTPQVAKADTKTKKKNNNKLQLELAAGIDLSGSQKGVGLGEYTLAMLRVPLNQKANLLLGAGYTNNKMTEGYKMANKPNVLNREIDARVTGLSMLQFPILYEQAIKDNQLFFRVGATPVYVLDAGIVNLANNSGGNPGNFRTFTIEDINKLNVLFTAGFQYRLNPRLGVELKGNYGLTELVKNSYINQSGENNNFKSLQVGLLMMLGKKR